MNLRWSNIAQGLQSKVWDHRYSHKQHNNIRCNSLIFRMAGYGSIDNKLLGWSPTDNSNIFLGQRLQPVQGMARIRLLTS